MKALLSLLCCSPCVSLVVAFPAAARAAAGAPAERWGDFFLGLGLGLFAFLALVLGLGHYLRARKKNELQNRLR